nr:hypothetical protein [Tanacetum cinerariifolium]
MEAHLAPKSPVQVNQIDSSCEICGGPHDTQICMDNPEQAIIDYASLRTDEARDKYIESLKLDKNGSAFIQGEILKKIKDPGLFTLPCRLGNSKPFDTLADLGSCVNLIPLYFFKTLNVEILEETENVLGLADGTRSYSIGIMENVKVYILKLKLLKDFYVIDMKKDPTCPLLVGKGFLATASAIIDCKKSKIAVGEGVAKIAVGEGVTRSIFRVKKIGLGAQTLYYLEKDFMNDHLPGELEIDMDVKLTPFKDVLVFRKMVEFLGAISINLKGNM